METSMIYTSLATDQNNLTFNFDQIPMNVKLKAIEDIASSKDPRTRCYWEFGRSTSPNWLSRWFLRQLCLSRSKIGQRDKGLRS